MSEPAAVDTYVRMLEKLAGQSAQIGARPIASHWPFVGTDYRRVLVVGQALAGWDDKTSPALWTVDAIRTSVGRRRVLDATRSWSYGRPEPMAEPLRTRSGSSFWSLSKRIVELLEPDGAGEWYSRLAWWNLFPLAWGDTNRSPWFDVLWNAQLPHVGQLFWEIVDFLDPTRIVILAGKDFWPHTSSVLGLADLEPLEMPLIAHGDRDGRRIVWTYHPGAHLRGVSRVSFAAAIAGALTTR